MRLGLHLSIGKGFKNTLKETLALNCNAVQTFVKNPRGWQGGAFDEEGASYVKANKDKLGIRPWVVHGSYLVNPCSPDSSIYEKSLASLLLEMERAISLGADYFVMHTGNRKGNTPEEAVLLLQKTIDQLLARFSGRVKILLENSSGKGSEIGSSFLELALITAPFPVNLLGICLDTCHAFSAGYDLRDKDAWAKTKNLLFAELDTKRLTLLHVNDSVGELNSHVDRHAHLGEGEIGKDGFFAIFQDDQMASIPCILETPGDPKVEGIKNIKFLRKMAQKNG